MTQSIFEKMGGTYRQEGDYLLPNLLAPEEPNIGIWSHRRRKYLKEHRRILYNSMLYSGRLNTHLEDVDKTASEMFGRLVQQMASQQGICEELKAQDQMTWVAAMNNIRSAAEEVINEELIYA